MKIILTFITLNTVNQVLSIIALFIIISFLIWLTIKIPLLFRKVKKLKVGNIEVCSEENSNNNTVVLPSKSHLNCPNVASLFILEELRDRYHEERMEISDKYTTVMEQLVYARMIVDATILDWSEEIDEKIIPYKRIVLENIRNTVVNKITEVFQENHLAEMSEEDILTRSKQRADAICSAVFAGSLNSKIEDDMKSMLKYCIIDIIKKGRNIQISKNEKVEKLKKAYKEKRERILRGELVDVCA